MQITYLQTILLKELRRFPQSLARLNQLHTRYAVDEDVRTLVDGGLVVSGFIGVEVIYRLSATGKELIEQVIADDAHTASLLVPSRAIPYPKECYVPAMNNGFIRNNGNKHILSRGM